MENCKNCGSDRVVEDMRFCPDCGQSQPYHRIDLHFLIHEIQHSLFHLDKGILFTMKELLVRPGKAISEFLNGKRVSHFKPLLLFVFMVAFDFAVEHYTGQDKAAIEASQNQEEYINNLKLGSGFGEKFDLEKVKYNFEWVQDFISKNKGKLPLIGIPILAFVLFLVFRKFYFAEYLIVATFLGSQYYLLKAIEGVLEWLIPLNIPYGLFIFGIFTFSLMQLFPAHNKLKVVGKSLLVLFFLGISLLVIILSFIAVLGWLSLK